MARLARLVVPDVPHHITQRGNRRQEVFFSDEDYGAYRDLVAEACSRNSVRCLAWCLMPNHVHLVLMPHEPDSLRAALADHRRYSRRINFAKGWSGYLWPPIQWMRRI
jgi:putative transposase